MKPTFVRPLVITAAILAVIGSGAVAASQDRIVPDIPGGQSFAEFEGYKSWENVSVSQNEDQVRFIGANPVMMEAYKKGLPAAGKTFPDGSRSVKLVWSRKKGDGFPFYTAGDLLFVEFTTKDSKRFPATDGWAYAIWQNDPATGVLKPFTTGTDCGHACHTQVADEDFVFTRYPPH